MVLRREEIKLNGRLVLVFSADEEAGSAYGAKVLVDRKLDADAILIAEPSGVDIDFDSIGIACRGALLGKVKVYGTQMHSSISDQGGCVNASIKMSEVLLEFAINLKGRLNYRANNLYPKGPTINPGVFLNGGVFYGVVPGEASFGFDIRTIPGMNNEVLVRDINDFLNELMKKDPDLTAELVLEKPPLDNLLPAEIDRGHELVKSCLSACKVVLGFEPELMGVPFSTDAIYFANQLDIPTIPSFGPGLIKLAHVPNEYIEIKSLVDAAKIYAFTAVSFLGTD
jgi:acetylornithine deacetylase